MEDDGRKAIISSVVVDFAPSEVKASYRLIKAGKRWKLDGVACGNGGEFNMDCGSSVCPDVSALRKKAGQGDADAQYTLGVMYNIGRGVKRNPSESASWFLKAAEQGHAHSQYYLGSIYEYGEGVTQGYAEAMEWYRKAAEQGNAKAQYNLGMRCQIGRGVKKDLAEAEKWLREAAKRGHTEAKQEVEKLDRR